jgi:hypothetical protein
VVRERQERQNGRVCFTLRSALNCSVCELFLCTRYDPMHPNPQEQTGKRALGTASRHGSHNVKPWFEACDARTPTSTINCVVFMQRMPPDSGPSWLDRGCQP